MKNKNKDCVTCKESKENRTKTFTVLMVIFSLYTMGCTVHTSYILISRLIEMF